MSSLADVLLDEREAAARARIRAAACGLKGSIQNAAGTTARDHPWAVPVIGFCAGLLATYLVPDRNPDPEENGCDRW